MVQVNMMDALRYAILANGELYVTTYLETSMLKWPADNWASTPVVLLLNSLLLALGQASSGLIMYNVEV